MKKSHEDWIAVEVSQLIDKLQWATGQPTMAIISHLQGQIVDELSRSMVEEPKASQNQPVQLRVDQMFAKIAIEVASGQRQPTNPTGRASGTGHRSSEISASDATRQSLESLPKETRASMREKLQTSLVVKSAIAELHADGFNRAELVAFRALHKAATPVVLDESSLGLKKFVISAGTCDRYHGGSRLDTLHYFDQNNFFRLARRLAKAVEFAKNKNALEEPVVELLRQWHHNITTNSTTYHCNDVIATPDAVVVEDATSVTTVFEFKGCTDNPNGSPPNEKLGITAKARQLAISMIATGATVGYLVLHNEPHPETADCFKLKVLSRKKMNTRSRSYQRVQVWLKDARWNLQLFWQAYQFVMDSPETVMNTIN